MRLSHRIILILISSLDHEINHLTHKVNPSFCFNPEYFVFAGKKEPFNEKNAFF